MQREIIETADGSKTIYLPEWNEHYHSIHGAVQEANHVFIKNGLQSKTDDYLTILEMGFGTGLNALLTFFESEKREQIIHYQSVEAYPILKNELEQMNFSDYSRDPRIIDIYQKMHEVAWNKACPISENFVIEKINSTIEQLRLPENSVDLCYYDAFGPRVQPELWTKDIFQNIYDWMDKDAVFVTYCAKGQVKRDLKAVGFLVETLQGPPGKREMIRAIKL
ncbi:MAG TPA: tRNA (5-methylaminomethyl-2-thiouridine)(34)-methyltransferase MnmD [Fluviicola sp.]|nr:tRNA (5-methylaminomethyl-2-thiouridine)(34)-methyltransferase MnmD [Fluviicola sp.]